VGEALAGWAFRSFLLSVIGRLRQYASIAQFSRCVDFYEFGRTEIFCISLRSLFPNLFVTLQLVMKTSAILSSSPGN